MKFVYFFLLLGMISSFAATRNYYTNQIEIAVKDNTLATCNRLVSTLVPSEAKPSCIYIKDRLTFKFVDILGRPFFYDVDTSEQVDGPDAQN